jgi:predicted PurR-regulated permease PerM
MASFVVIPAKAGIHITPRHRWNLWALQVKMQSRAVCMEDFKVEIPTTTATSVSLKVLAAATLLAFVYLASTILIALTCSVLIAFVLDPGVVLLERMRLPRWLGSLIMVLVALSLIYLIIYLAYGSIVAFTAILPQLAVRVEELATHLASLIRALRNSATMMLPANAPAAGTTVRLQTESPWLQFLMRGIGSVYAFVVTVMFIPFLVFFMLTSKTQVMRSTLNLFPLERRNHAKIVIEAISQMLRRYIFGNILVALISAAVITPVFGLIGLRYALVLGPLAAILNLIPYLGVPLAVLPPGLIALMEFEHPGPMIAVLLTVVVVHFFTANMLTPLLVGSRVRLNALSVTISVMLGGWLWGGFGLLLAVPIVASLKAVCDNVDSLRPLGDWLGDG